MGMKYVVINTQDQSIDSQKNLISHYSLAHKWIVNEWFELEISSRKECITTN